MQLPGPPAPFVLIDDAREQASQPARLYVDPVEIVRADSVEAVMPALERLRTARRNGLHAAGYLAYEAGFAFEPRLSRLAGNKPDRPLLWFGLFNDVTELAPAEVPALFDGCGKADWGRLQPSWSQEQYAAAFAQVQAMIRAGDIYQANLSFDCTVPVSGDMRALYAALRPHSQAGHGALVMTGEHWLLSFSPELFFTLDGDRLTTRPMKGTALRDSDAGRDAANAQELRSDPKQRAENLMIVDLLRNDLSRVAVPGSVAVPQLFEIEHYPTVLQMTSTVTGRLRPELDAVDVLAALFPCGSITGAPKLRAMEIIHAIEGRARGAYTGAIGHLDPNGDAEFNVAIRTICVEYDSSAASLGLGSGVVSDSVCADEWRECLDKGRFLDTGSEPATKIDLGEASTDGE